MDNDVLGNPCESFSSGSESAKFFVAFKSGDEETGQGVRRAFWPRSNGPPLAVKHLL